MINFYGNKLTLIASTIILFFQDCIYSPLVGILRSVGTENHKIKQGCPFNINNVSS